MYCVTFSWNWHSAVTVPKKYDLVVVVGVEDFSDPAGAYPYAKPIFHAPCSLFARGALAPDPDHDVSHKRKPDASAQI